MLVQINSDIKSYSESLSTLKFAERVSGVELGAAKSSKDGRDVRELMEQVLNLIMMIMLLIFKLFHERIKCLLVNLVSIYLSFHCLFLINTYGKT